MRSYIQLGKPRIASLLIYTSLATYIYAKPGVDQWILLFFIGGLLTVFGSNAINSYIDRELDYTMLRTRFRPIPRGDITPSKAISIGIIWFTLGTTIITYFFGLYAGLAALIGGLYYIIIYSIYLKKRTIWNTVIGGFAGSMPTITGWLAAGKPLSLEPVILAIIVFLWTPGHFWSLAYKVKEEYMVVDLPMLPVVKDDRYTRKMIIVFYLLTLASMAVSIFIFEGLIYRIATLTSIIFLAYAIHIIRVRFDKETAWRSFKISSPILALLYTGLLIDGLI